MFKYFCNYCGNRFDSDLPERDEHGYMNDVYCPKCGGYDVYPDTPSGAKESIRHQTAYENRLAGLDD